MSQRVYDLVQWLLFSRLVRGYGEHHGPYEDVLLGYLLCFFLEIPVDANKICRWCIRKSTPLISIIYLNVHEIINSCKSRI